MTEPISPSPTAPRFSIPDPDYARVQTALSELMIRDRNPWQEIGLLLVSAVLFIVIGLRSHGWTSLLALVIVIFFHEFGHYLTMRRFGYRRVKMFFIPMLGAATSGAEARPDARHQAVVALMGPVPGILVGLPLLALATSFHQPVLISLAGTFIGINAFNLLPVSPLDGGRFFEAILFSRHSTIEIIFKTCAMMAFLYVLAMRHFPVHLLVFAVIIALISGYRRSRVAYRLRKTMPAPPESANPDYIPPDWVRLLLAEVKETRVKGLFNIQPSAKVLAVYCREVWQKMRTRQASLSATLGLLTLYGAALFIAVSGPHMIRQKLAPPPAVPGISQSNPQALPMTSRALLMPTDQVILAGKTILVVPAPWTVIRDTPTNLGTLYRLEEPANTSRPGVYVSIAWMPLATPIAAGVAPTAASASPLLARLDTLEVPTRWGPPMGYLISQMKPIQQSGCPAWAILRTQIVGGRRFLWRHRLLPYEKGTLAISDRSDASADPKAVAAALLPLLQAIHLPPIPSEPPKP